MTPRVLVVEDEWLLATMFEDMLAELGYQAELAGDLASAKRHAASGIFDFAILDVNLDDIRSDELAKELMEKGVPVILATGYDAARLDHVRKSADLLKPYDAMSLRCVIATALGRDEGE